MKNKKAFVLLETIVVITVLCIILITLYASYSQILINVKNVSFYDNTEYVCKTELIRKYIESKPDIMNLVGTEPVVVYCSDTLDKKCSEVDGSELFEFMKVKAIYFTLWNIDARNEYVINLEPTTQNYIKALNAVEKESAYRIIVMYEPENDELSTDYEYASLRLGSRE